MLQARETRNSSPEIDPETPSDVTSGNEITLIKRQRKLRTSLRLDILLCRYMYIDYCNQVHNFFIKNSVDDRLNCQCTFNT